MRKVITVSILLIITAVIAYMLGQRSTHPIISPLGKGPTTNVLGIFSIKKDPEDLKEQVTAAIGSEWENYSIYVVDLNSDFTMGINEHEMFTGASVNKIPILAALYDQAQNGKVNMDQMITLQASDIQAYGTGSIQNDPPGSTYSVKTLARLMMQVSDNTAAYLLGNYVVGLDTVQSIINSWGLTQTDMTNNKTSNADMALLMTKMFRGDVTNASATAEMLGFMTNSDYEDRLPADLPKDVTVYHKIGNGDTGEIHDVGIVVHGDTKYYVGILTTGVTDDDAAEKLEAKLSRIIYDFMN